jgi:hypothetical protein
VHIDVQQSVAHKHHRQTGLLGSLTERGLPRRFPGVDMAARLQPLLEPLVQVQDHPPPILGDDDR